MSKLFVLLSLAVLVACGKNSSSSKSGARRDHLTGNQASLVKELLKSYNRLELAIYGHGGDAQLDAMRDILQKEIVEQRCQSRASQPDIRMDSIFGNACVINWNGETNFRVRDSLNLEGSFDHTYDVLNEGFRRLNDVDHFRISGEVHKRMENGGQLFTKTKSGTLRSQRQGLVDLEQKDDLRTTYMTHDPQKWWGTKTLVLNFPQWTAKITMKFEDLEAQYELNGVEITDEELKLMLKHF